MQQLFAVDGNLQLKINEIYFSVQGESTWAGLPCVFVRLTACDLRCSYCDTEYAFYEGVRRSVDEILAEVLAFDCSLVEITGGEPLLQKNIFPLMTALCDADRTVLIGDQRCARHFNESILVFTASWTSRPLPAARSKGIFTPISHTSTIAMK